MPGAGADSLPAMPAQPSGWQETNHRVAGRERLVALRAALNAAVIAAILSLVPYASIVAMPIGGFLAVLFYRRRSWRAEPSLAGAFRLGVLAGILASAILGIVVAAGASFSTHDTELQQQMIKNRQNVIDRLQSSENRTSDSQQRQEIQQIVEYLKTPQGMTAMVVLTVAIMTVMFIVLSGLGGMLSASLLRRKGPRG